MNRNALALRLFPLSFIFLFSCSNPQSSKTSPVTSTEKWAIIEPGTQNTATLLLSKHQDNTVTADGEWIYYFYGYKITCTYMSGSAQVTDSTITVSARGTGAYPADSTGTSDKSAFLLNMYGKYSSQSMSGTWNITFDDTTWNGWVDSGSFTGTLDSGGNVTKH
jgi:hypothetical protein